MDKIEIIVERTKTGFSASTVKYPVYTSGNNIEEIKSNMIEALNLFFSHNKKENINEESIILQFDVKQ